MNILATATPILTGLILWAILYHAQPAQKDWRSALLSAALVWAVYLVAVTEILSLLGAITFTAILAAWVLGLLIALTWAARSIGDPRTLFEGLRLPRLSPFEIVLVAGGAFIAATVAVIAWVAPPNSYDSMTYHMPRVMHWIQDRSLAYYPTNMLAQLFLTPGGEFFILHFQILAGSDRLANFVALFSMLGSAVGVSLIARQLGASRQGQLISALVCMTIPMGILQASSTEDNCITAFWLVCFVYWMLSSTRPNAGIFSLAASGASLGLAALCKATTYVFALPFLTWFGLSLLSTYRAKSLLRLGLIALIFLLINLGSYLRSYELFGNPLGMAQEVSSRQPEIDFKYSNDVFSVPQLISNVVRNTALHLGTPSQPINAALESGMRAFHGLLGISADDARTTWGDYKFSVPTLQFNESTDGNALHLILGAIGLVLVLAHPRRLQGLALYSLCVLAGYLLFCFYLKWQPYFSRLHLPLFALFAPVLGRLSDQVERAWVPRVVSLLLLVAALPWVFLNHSRPLLGPQTILTASRDSLYFRSRQPVIEQSYVLATDFVAEGLHGQCSRVGVILDNNDYEYPFWVLLSQKTGRLVSLESMDVQNISRLTSSSFPEFTPCAVFTINNLPHDNLRVNGRLYAQAWTSYAVSVLLPK